MSMDDKNYDLSQKRLYQKLERLYENNGFYEREFANNTTFRTFSEKTIKPIRSIVNRSVEFYCSKLSVPMTISSENQSVIDAVNQFLLWSNFSAIKPISLRQLSLFGNLFFKVCCDGKKVWTELIDPKYITELTLSPKGFITEIRIDIPTVNEKNQTETYTEYWTKEYFSIWQHGLGENAPLDTLGDPQQTGWLTDMGLDNFIPIVMCKFKDIGKKYGVGSCNHALDKILEANKEASRLSDLVFRYMKDLIVISANDKDANGKPKYAPKVSDDKDLFKDEDDSILYINGLATVNQIIPNINYDSFLAVLKDMMSELESDCPEIRYYSLNDSNLSGKSIRMLMSPAIDRANEALANYLQALIRVNKIALTLGKFWGIFNLTGSYEDGSWDHSIDTPELFPLSEDEKATTIKSYTDAGLALSTALRIVGYDETFIAKALEEKSTQDTNSMTLAQTSLGSALNQFNSGV